jgi:hypothetical protein
MLMFLPFWFTKLSEYMKVVKIVMVQVLSLVKDERTFNNLSFTKSKFHNWLSIRFNFVFTCSPKTFTSSLIFLAMKPWHFGRRSTLDTRLITKEMQVFYFINVVFYLLLWGQICLWNICLLKMQVVEPIFLDTILNVGQVCKKTYSLQSKLCGCWGSLFQNWDLLVFMWVHNSSSTWVGCFQSSSSIPLEEIWVQSFLMFCV